MSFLTDLFKDFKDMFLDWPIGTIFGILVILAISIVVGIIIHALYKTFDEWGLATKSTKASVIDFSYRPAHSETSLLHVGDVLVPQFNSYSESWKVQVEIEGKTAWGYVSRRFFENAKRGDSVTVMYTRGRFSGKINIKNVQSA